MRQADDRDLERGRPTIAAPRAAPPAGSRTSALLGLQRSAGNRAVGHLLQRVHVEGTDKSNFMMAAQLASGREAQTAIKAELDALPADRKFATLEELRTYLVEKNLIPAAAAAPEKSAPLPSFDIRKGAVEKARVQTVLPNLAGATITFSGGRFRSHLLGEGDGQAGLDRQGALEVVRTASLSQLAWSVMSVDVSAVDADYAALQTGAPLRTGTYQYRVSYGPGLRVVFSTHDKGKSAQIFHVGPGSA